MTTVIDTLQDQNPAIATATKTTTKTCTANSDFKDEEANTSLVTEIDALFEEHRIIEDLTFDISKQEKLQQLQVIERQIAALIERIEHKHGYHHQHQTANNNNNTDSSPPQPSNIDDSARQTATTSASTTATTTSATAVAVISRAHYLYVKGRYLKLCGEVQSASPLLMEAIKLDPDLIDCWNTLGDIYYARGEIVAAKYCLQSALEYDGYNKLSYITLSKILRKPASSDEMEVMESCIESLILAKLALKNGKKCNALQDGELWFNLGNAYLMAFLTCANGWKLQSSMQLETQTEKEKKNKEEADSPTKLNGVKHASNGASNGAHAVAKVNEESAVDFYVDDAFFTADYEAEAVRAQLRKEIESELNDASNNLLSHVYIKKCLSAYKCASIKCSRHKHHHHPDLYFNRSYLHIWQEHYDEALQDLKASIAYSDESGSGGGVGGGGDEDCPAKIFHANLLSKLYKISKQIGGDGAATNAKMQRKNAAFCSQMQQYRKTCSHYFTSQLHYDLVTFAQLSEGFNGGSVVVLKVLGVLSPTQPLPLQFVCIDHTGVMFVLAFYLKGHALNHVYKVVNQTNVVNASTLLCVANPVKRHIKFTHGSKQIDFYSITFQKAQDVCIGGKFYFNQ